MLKEIEMEAVERDSMKAVEIDSRMAEDVWKYIVIDGYVAVLDPRVV